MLACTRGGYQCNGCDGPVHCLGCRGATASPRRRERRDRLEKYLSYRIAAGEPLYGVYPPTPQVRADYEAWARAGARPEDAPHVRAEAVNAR